MHRFPVLKSLVVRLFRCCVVAAAMVSGQGALGQQLPPSPVNLLARDGSFGAVGDWRFDPTTMKITKEGGISFLRMTNAGRDRAIALTRNITLPPGNNFVRVSVRMRTKGLEPRGEKGQEARVGLRFLNTEGETVGAPPEMPALRTDSGWVSREVQLDVPTGATELQLQPGLWRATGTLDIDDLRVEVYPTRADYLSRAIRPMEDEGIRVPPLINTVPDLDIATDRVYAVKAEWLSLGIDLRAQVTGFVPGNGGAKAARARAEFFDGRGKPLGGEVSLMHIAAKSDGWHPVSAHPPIPEGARFVRLRFSLDNAAGMLVVDGLKLTPEREAPLADAVLSPNIKLGWGEEAASALSGRRGSIALNGVWRFIPAVGPAEREPSVGWGYARVPADWKGDSTVVARGSGRLWTTFRGSDLSRAWYERTIKIPSAWMGRAVLIDLRRVRANAVIYIDGSEAGHIAGPFGTVDITPFVEAGKEARLRIRVSATDDEGVRHSDEGGAVGLIGNVTLLSRPRGAHVSDVFVRPSTRKNTLSVDVELASVEKVGPVTFTARMLDEQGKVEKSFSAQAPVKQAETQTVTLTFPWPNARRWDVEQPNLYTLQLAVAGASLDDEYPQTFGFREFWIEGRKFFLNGTELRLRPTRLADGDPTGGGISAARKILRDGFNFGFGAYGADDLGRRGTADPLALYEDADRTGLPCSATAGSLPLLPSSGDASAMNAEYRRQMTAELRLLRNHPSVLLYGTSMGALGPDIDPDPRFLDRVGSDDTVPDGQAASQKANEAIRLIKKFDPTRPVFTYPGSAAGDFPAVRLSLNIVPLQEREEWLSDWAKNGKLPFGAIDLGNVPQIRRGREGYPFSGSGEPLITEWCAAYLGRRAYETESASYRGGISDSFSSGQESLIRPPAFQEWEALFTRNTWRSWRTWGIPGGILPWDGGQGIPEVARNNGPTLAWIAGPKEAFTAKDHSFTAGQLVAKTLVLINDRRADMAYSGEWKATVGEATIGGGLFRGVVKSAESLMLPIEFGVPAVSAKTEGKLTVTASIGSDKHEDAFAFRVFPGDSATVQPEVVAFDPAGETSVLLKALGYVVKPLKEGDPLPEGGILVVGRRALSDRHVLPESLPAFLRKGGRLLVMGQDPPWIAQSLGLRVAPVLARRVYRVNPGDPVFSGLDDTDLCDWSGSSHLVPTFIDYPDREPDRRNGWHWGNRGALTSAPIEKPHRGSWRPLLETEFDLAYTPLMEMEYGTGRITLCTLDLEDYIATDPAARRLAERILEHVTGDPVTAKGERTLYLGDEAGAKLLTMLGVTYEQASGVPAEGVGLLVLSATAKPDDAALTAFLERGGRALVLAGRLGTGPLEATYGKAATFGGSLKVPDWPETAGLSPSDLRWRADNGAYLIMPGDGREIAADNLLARKLVGKGVILYCQIDPTWLPADEKTYFRFTRWRQTRALSQILANLGASFAQDDRLVSLLTRSEKEKADRPSPGFYHDDYLPEDSPSGFRLADDPYRFFLPAVIPAKDSGGQGTVKRLQ